jgi:hypothetical protein
LTSLFSAYCNIVLLLMWLLLLSAGSSALCKCGFRVTAFAMCQRATALNLQQLCCSAAGVVAAAVCRLQFCSRMWLPCQGLYHVFATIASIF